MKNYKKLLIAALATVAATSLAACFGASPDNGGNGQSHAGQWIEYVKTQKEVGVTISQTERNLTVGDKFLLQPSYDKIEGYSMKFSSDNDSVAAVDEVTGLVTALNVGTANVKAVYTNGVKKAEATVKIICDFGNYLPEVKLGNVLQNAGVELYAKATFKLAPYVSFNGVSFADGTFSYIVEDTSIASVSNGVITANKNGETSLTIDCTWRGKRVIESVPVTVTDRVVFYNDGVALSDKTIYTVANAGGATYATSIPNKFSVNYNGTEYTGGVTCTIANSGIAKSYGSNIISQAFGETTATVTAKIGGMTINQSFTITVLRPEVKISGTVPMFATDYGIYLDQATSTRKTLMSYANITDELVDAYQGKNALTISGDKILGITSSNLGGRGVAQVTLGTAERLYTFNLETVAKFFTEASDLKELEINTAGARVGYYELLNNIDASGITLSHTSASGNAYFGGVFEGNGYHIKNLTIAENNSMFGAIAGGSKVQNLALIDLKASNAYYFTQANGQESGLTFEQIYIKVSNETVNPIGMLCYSGTGNAIKNVVIEYVGANAQKNRVYSGNYHGSFMAGMSRGCDENEENIVDKNKSWIDVFVISPYVLGFSTGDGWIKNTVRPSPQAALYVYGANEETDLYGANTSVTLHARPSGIENLGWSNENYYNMKLVGVYRWDSVDDMALELIENEKDLSSFSAEYWNIEIGYPVWKNK